MFDANRDRLPWVRRLNIRYSLDYNSAMYRASNRLIRSILRKLPNLENVDIRLPRWSIRPTPQARSKIYYNLAEVEELHTVFLLNARKTPSITSPMASAMHSLRVGSLTFGYLNRYWVPRRYSGIWFSTALVILTPKGAFFIGNGAFPLDFTHPPWRNSVCVVVVSAPKSFSTC